MQCDDMFAGYGISTPRYTSGNICNTIRPPVSPNKLPYEEYDANNNLIGYWWYEKDILNLQFNITGEVTVSSDDIIYVISGQEPTDKTVGKLDQKAYNLTDNKSWTCVMVDDNGYTWQLDSTYVEPASGDRNVYISVANFMSDKQVSVYLYNFRWEEIDKQVYQGSPEIIYAIDSELSDKLVKGIYHCKLVVESSNVLRKTIYQQTDINITIK